MLLMRRKSPATRSVGKGSWEFAKKPSRPEFIRTNLYGHFIIYIYYRYIKEINEKYKEK